MRQRVLNLSPDRGRQQSGSLDWAIRPRDRQAHSGGECSRRSASRRGGFIVVVVVCLVLAGMLLASLLKLALLHERQLGNEQVRLQAAWLVESGLARAASRLARDDGYTGETWNIPAAQVGGPDGAVVVIRIVTEESAEPRRTIVVEANYPAEGPCQARLTRQAIIHVSKES